MKKRFRSLIALFVAAIMLFAGNAVFVSADEAPTKEAIGGGFVALQISVAQALQSSERIFELVETNLPYIDCCNNPHLIPTILRITHTTSTSISPNDHEAWTRCDGGGVYFDVFCFECGYINENEIRIDLESCGPGCALLRRR